MPTALDPRLTDWTRDRRRVWAVVIVLVALLATAYLLLQEPVLETLGRAAGGSATAAVALGWALFAVPTALAVPYPVLWRPRLTRTGRRLASAALAAAFLPAVAVGPGRRSGFDTVREEAREHAPLVADALVTGFSAGLWANLLAGLLALAILVKANPKFLVFPVAISVGVLSLAVQSAPAARPEPRLRPHGLLAPGTLWGEVLRPVAVEQTGSCAGATAAASTDAVLEERGCRGLVRMLVEARESGIVLAASIAELPSRGRVLEAAQRLVLRASPRPLARAGAAPGRVDRRFPAEIGQTGRYVVIVAALEARGGAPASEDALRDAIGAFRTAVFENVQAG